jgi:hypothetical protein
MSYYTLPKKIIDVEFDPLITNSHDCVAPFISYSLCNYLTSMNEQFKKIRDSDLYISHMEDDNVLFFLNKAINPYEFIFTKVPSSKLSVSKLKPHSNLFYILMEIVNNFNLLDGFYDKDIKTLSYGANADSIIEFVNIFREESSDIHLKSNICIENSKIIFNESNEHFREETYDFLYYELHDKDYLINKNYITGFIYILCNLLYYQSPDGVSIIKIDNIYYKPIVEIMYILTSIYDKVHVIKPTLANAVTNERYIICKNFIVNSQKTKLYAMYFANLGFLLKTLKEEEQTVSLLKNELPYYFINKLEELNIIIGHQQLEFMDQLISLYKNKNKEDKIETLKKNNIQKCIQWCDKFKIPYNKFTDKVNIFLNGDKSSNESSENIFLSYRNTTESNNCIVYSFEETFSDQEFEHDFDAEFEPELGLGLGLGLELDMETQQF